MDADRRPSRTENSQRLIQLQERLRDYRSQLASGQVSEQLWSGFVECGVEAASLRQEAMDLLSREPDSARRRHVASCVVSIERDIWSYTDAVATLCLKGMQGAPRREP